MKPFSVCTKVGKCILVERFYHDCSISINCKDAMADLLELDLADLDVILAMDSIHACYASVN